MDPCSTIIPAARNTLGIPVPVMAVSILKKDTKLHYALRHLVYVMATHYRVHCKVAGSNLTCRDDWKTRWRLHSVDLTSTGLSLPDQNIIHSPVARVVYG